MASLLVKTYIHHPRNEISGPSNSACRIIATLTALVAAFLSADRQDKLAVSTEFGFTSADYYYFLLTVSTPCQQTFTTTSSRSFGRPFDRSIQKLSGIQVLISKGNFCSWASPLVFRETAVQSIHQFKVFPATTACHLQQNHWRFFQ